MTDTTGQKTRYILQVREPSGDGMTWTDIGKTGDTAGAKRMLKSVAKQDQVYRISRVTAEITASIEQRTIVKLT